MAIEAELGAARRRRAAPRAAVGARRPDQRHRPGPRWPIMPRQRRRHAVLRLAPVAARRAAARGCAPRGGGAVRARAAVRRGAAAARRAELETRLADALYATDDQVESIAARAAGARASPRGGRCRRRGRRPCHLVTSYSCRGMMADARAAAEEALRCSSRSTRRRRWARRTTPLAARAVPQRFRRAAEWGERAVASAPATTLSRLPTSHLDRYRRAAARRPDAAPAMLERGARAGPGAWAGAADRRGPTTTWRSRGAAPGACGGRRAHRGRPRALRRARPRPVDVVHAWHEGARRS